MFDSFSALHDPHNRRLCFVVTIGRNSFMSGLILLLSLLQLDLINFDPHLGICEADIVAKFVCGVHILPTGLLGQDAIFGARQGLQRPLQLRIRCNKLV